MNIVQRINDMITPEYCHRQLAEECAELAQAALKMVRVIKHETPKAPEDALDAFIEEMADVEVMQTIAMHKILTPADRALLCVRINEKTQRFYDRLSKGGKADAQMDG